MRTITKTVAAAALVVSLSTTPSRAGMEPIHEGAGLLFGALFLGLVGLLVATGGDGDTNLSTKNGPALDLDLPDPGIQTIKDF